jgi:hypothetical protein
MNEPTGKRLTLNDIFARRAAQARAEYAERLAYEATPEGKAEAEARRALDARLAAADERFAQENPPDLFAEGRIAGGANMKREAPETLSEDEEAEWLAGYDSEAPEER